MSEPTDPGTKVVPPAPCILFLVADGWKERPIESIHELLNGVDTFAIDPAAPNDWLNAVFTTPMYSSIVQHIPEEILQSDPPKIGFGSTIVFIDFGGLFAEPKFPGQDPTPTVRLGRLDKPEDTITGLPEIMILPGSTLTDAIGPMLAAFDLT